jgi:hypothetical protein
MSLQGARFKKGRGDMNLISSSSSYHPLIRVLQWPNRFTLLAGIKPWVFIRPIHSPLFPVSIGVLRDSLKSLAALGTSCDQRTGVTEQ